MATSAGADSRTRLTGACRWPIDSPWCPLISAGQREAVAAFVPDDAPVAFRGTVPDGPGYWFPPTVLHPVRHDDRAAVEEIFGPVACVIPFRD